MIPLIQPGGLAPVQDVKVFIPKLCAVPRSFTASQTDDKIKLKTYKQIKKLQSRDETKNVQPCRLLKISEITTQFFAGVLMMSHNSLVSSSVSSS